MVITLTGSNGFLLDAKLQSIKSEFLKTNDALALETIDASELEPGRIIDAVTATSFLSPKRLLIIKGLAANKPAAEQIEKIIESTSDSTSLIVVEPKIDKRGVLYKTLKKQTEMHEFHELDYRDLPKWVVSQVQAYGGQISNADAVFLVERIGSSQLELANEISKLINYNPKIDRHSITILTDQAPQSSIFDLIDAAFSGRPEKALALYEDQRAQNVEPLAIEALFVWQMHILALVKTADAKTPESVAAESGINPYVAKKSALLAKQKTLKQIKQYVAGLTEAEYHIKTSSVDADDIMKNYIVSLSTN